MQYMAAPFAPAQLAHIGFDLVMKLNVDRELERIQPSGGTSLLDAILESTRKFKKLCGMLQKTGDIGQWHLYHVILTDGEDTMSRNPSERVKSASLECIRTSGTVNWHNHVFCIQPGDIHKNPLLLPLQQLSDLLTFHYHSNADVVANMQSFGASMTPPCALLLTIDMSESMQDCWMQVKMGVGALVQGLQGNSLLAVTCFHEDVMTLNEAQILPMEHKRAMPPQEILPSSRLPSSSSLRCPNCSVPSCLLS